MKNIEIVAKIGKFFTVVSALFAVLTAVVGYLVIGLLYPSAPIDFKILSTVQTMFPYLFVTVLSVVVAVVCLGVAKEGEAVGTPEDTEVPPETAPTQETT